MVRIPVCLPGFGILGFCSRNSIQGKGFRRIPDRNSETTEGITQNPRIPVRIPVGILCNTMRHKDFREQNPRIPKKNSEVLTKGGRRQ